VAFQLKVVSIFMALMVVVVPFACAVEATNQPGKKFRIGYIETNDFWAFSEIMNATKKSLDKMGWLSRIEFPEDAIICTGWGTPDTKKILADKSAELMARKDLDMIISAGTPPTAALLKANNGKTPIFAIGVSDPIKSKFVISAKDSGVDNFTARVVPERFTQMFTIFHEVVRFKKLGLIYSDSEDGRVFSNVDDARKTAQDLGFQVVEYKQLKDTDTANECLKGINWLIQQGIDAFFQPAVTCFDWKKSDVKKILDTLTEHKIPVFAREGTLYVKAGALMGFSSIDFGPRGDFNAKKIIRIFQGEKPRSLPMVDGIPPKLSFNIRVAEEIGFNPPFVILGASDEIFKEITLPDDRMIK
jgi:ABC-type uncharacterized transport system substrate-binding protein